MSASIHRPNTIPAEKSKNRSIGKLFPVLGLPYSTFLGIPPALIIFLEGGFSGGGLIVLGSAPNRQQRSEN
jgi:hypothetical protein